MLVWLLLMAGGAASATYTTGILFPVVDTGGDFSTNTDPDELADITLSTALNPTD